MLGKVLCGVFCFAAMTRSVAPQAHVRIGDMLFEAWSSMESGGRLIRSTGRVTYVGTTGQGHLEIAADCSVVLRVYSADDALAAPVWDGLAHRRMCFDMTRLLDLAPGQSVEFTQTDSVARVVDLSKPARPFRLSVVFRLSGARLELPARELVRLGR
jgi:hypothetical protein